MTNGMEYIIMISLAIILPAIISTTVYYFYRRRLITKIFAIFLPISGFIAIVSYVIGKEGISFLTGSIALIVTISSILLGVSILHQYVTKPIRPLANAMRIITQERKLNVQVDQSNTEDELAAMQKYFNQIVKKISSTISNLNEEVSSLTDNLVDIQTITNNTNSVAIEQNASLTQVQVAMDQIHQNSIVTSDHALNVLNTAKEAHQAGQSSIDSVLQSTDTLYKAITQVEQVVSKILELNEQSAQIADIVSSVSELAEQSNLLAVNASIKASRAGENGRGFAVVANEVRNLARQSKTATNSIQVLLEEIQTNGSDVVKKAQQTTKLISTRREDLRSVQEIIGELTIAIQLNMDKATQISAATQQQAVGLKQIAEALKAFSQSSKDTIDGTKHLEHASNELLKLHGQLSKVVTSYIIEA